MSCRDVSARSTELPELGVWCLEGSVESPLSIFVCDDLVAVPGARIAWPCRFAWFDAAVWGTNASE